MRKGLTLIELLIVVVFSFLVIAALMYFFSAALKTNIDVVRASRGGTSFFQIAEIINSDIVKAGYGIDNQTVYIPVEWDATNSTLLVRYVNYDDPACKTETFKDGVNDDCDYQVKYIFKNNNLYRQEDKRADNTWTNKYPMFDPDIVKITSFNVSVNATSHVVSYSITGKVDDKDFSIGDTIICRNWH
ncbi:MAG: hypothetical protein GXO39_05735 [Thermotogae bacterium]|nr:hypothetical protein [Thermotogota bacterium]